MARPRSRPADRRRWLDFTMAPRRLLALAASALGVMALQFDLDAGRSKVGRRAVTRKVAAVPRDAMQYIALTETRFVALTRAVAAPPPPLSLPPRAVHPGDDEQARRGEGLVQGAGR